MATGRWQFLSDKDGSSVVKDAETCGSIDFSLWSRFCPNEDLESLGYLFLFHCFSVRMVKKKIVIHVLICLIIIVNKGLIHNQSADNYSKCSIRTLIRNWDR